MSLPLYLDVHVDGRVTRGLIARGVDVLRAQDDAAARFSDADLLDRATQLNRVMVSYDDDFLSETATRVRSGGRFSGLIFVCPVGLTIGQLIEQLQIVADCTSPGELENRILYVPL